MTNAFSGRVIGWCLWQHRRPLPLICVRSLGRVGGWSMRLTGRCLCGAVSYSSDAEPEAMVYCHCDDCRRTTGSAFNVGVCVAADSVHVIGEVKAYTVQAEGGNQTRREFCPNCGSPLFTRYPDKIYIKAGTLDHSDGLRPTRQIWTEMAVSWSQIPDGIESYSKGRTKV